MREMLSVADEITKKEPDSMDVALGAAIRIRRRIHGLSQEALAQKCGVTFQQIQKYESGFNRVSFSRLVLISRALGCRVTELLSVLELDEDVQDSLDLVSTLALPGATDLLAAYGRIPPAARASLIGLIRAIEQTLATASPAADQGATARATVD